MLLPACQLADRNGFILSLIGEHEVTEGFDLVEVDDVGGESVSQLPPDVVTGSVNLLHLRLFVAAHSESALLLYLQLFQFAFEFR